MLSQQDIGLGTAHSVFRQKLKQFPCKIMAAQELK